LVDRDVMASVLDGHDVDVREGLVDTDADRTREETCPKRGGHDPGRRV
jgi:hypothetical protein